LPAAAVDDGSHPVGHRRERHAVGVVLLTVQGVTCAQGGDQTATGHPVQRDQAVDQDGVGHQPHPGHERAQHDAIGLHRQRSEQGEGMQGGAHALPDGPQVVEDEHAVEAGGFRSPSHGDRGLGVVPELRQCDPDAH
jgi:hypothetical protein